MFDFIPAREMDGIFANTFGTALCRRGFEQVERRKWVRSDRAPIRELFRIAAIKGASLSPVWGFSLDFVPHSSGSTIRWHRSNKSAIFDLRYDPIDYTASFDEWSIPSSEGRTAAREQADRSTHVALELALPWFQSVGTERDLIREFEAKKERPFVRFGFDNYVQEPLAYAFTLAKVGRSVDAESEVNRWATRLGLHQSVRDALLRRLRE
jgi:hypothetical protein